MGRWSYLDTDEERLPSGLRRVGYDADTQTYTYADKRGNHWEGAPGCQYGTINRVRTAQETMPLPSFTTADHQRMKEEKERENERKRAEEEEREKNLPPLPDDVLSFLAKRDKTGETDSDSELDEKKGGLAWEKCPPKGMSRSNTLKKVIRERLDDMFDERIQSFRNPKPAAPRPFSLGPRRKTAPMNEKPVSRSDTLKSQQSVSTASSRREKPVSRSNTERSERSARTARTTKSDESLGVGTSRTKKSEKSEASASTQRAKSPKKQEPTQEEEAVPKRAHTERVSLKPPRPRSALPAEYKNEKTDKRARRMTVSPLALFQLALEKPPASPRKSRRDGPRLPPELLQRRGTL